MWLTSTLIVRTSKLTQRQRRWRASKRRRRRCQTSSFRQSSSATSTRSTLRIPGICFFVLMPYTHSYNLLFFFGPFIGTLGFLRFTLPPLAWYFGWQVPITCSGFPKGFEPFAFYPVHLGVQQLYASSIRWHLLYIEYSLWCNIVGEQSIFKHLTRVKDVI